MTLGRSGRRYWAAATTSWKRCRRRRGGPTMASLVWPCDCSWIHSAAIDIRRPMVITRSGQGGSSGSLNARSRWWSEGMTGGLAVANWRWTTRRFSTQRQGRWSAMVRTWALSPSLSDSTSQISGSRTGAAVGLAPGKARSSVASGGVIGRLRRIGHWVDILSQRPMQGDQGRPEVARRASFIALRGRARNRTSIRHGARIVCGDGWNPDGGRRSMSAERESARLAALGRYGVLDSPRQAVVGRIAEMAGIIYAAPMAAISLVDGGRVWFKSRIGIDPPELPRGGTLSQRTAAHAAPHHLTPSAAE